MVHVGVSDRMSLGGSATDAVHRQGSCEPEDAEGAEGNRGVRHSTPAAGVFVNDLERPSRSEHTHHIPVSSASCVVHKGSYTIQLRFQGIRAGLPL
jgi:hypothetical protein